jgi:hypothetical protein
MNTTTWLGCWLTLCVVVLVQASSSCSSKGFDSANLPCQLCAAIHHKQIASDCRGKWSNPVTGHNWSKHFQDCCSESLGNVQDRKYVKIELVAPPKQFLLSEYDGVSRLGLGFRFLRESVVKLKEFLESEQAESLLNFRVVTMQTFGRPVLRAFTSLESPRERVCCSFLLFAETLFSKNILFRKVEET